MDLNFLMLLITALVYTGFGFYLGWSAQRQLIITETIDEGLSKPEVLVTIWKFSPMTKHEITTDFTLFNVAMINPITMERIEQGEMRARDAKAFVEEMDGRGIPTMVTSYSESDTLAFTEYMLKKG